MDQTPAIRGHFMDMDTNNWMELVKDGLSEMNKCMNTCVKTSEKVFEQFLWAMSKKMPQHVLEEVDEDLGTTVDKEIDSLEREHGIDEIVMSMIPKTTETFFKSVPGHIATPGNTSIYIDLYIDELASMYRSIIAMMRMYGYMRLAQSEGRTHRIDLNMDEQTDPDLFEAMKPLAEMIVKMREAPMGTSA